MFKVSIIMSPFENLQLKRCSQLVCRVTKLATNTSGIFGA
jgi:hypothetical protein